MKSSIYVWRIYNFIEMYHAVYRQKVIVNTADMISRARYLDMYNEAVILT